MRALTLLIGIFLFSGLSAQHEIDTNFIYKTNESLPDTLGRLTFYQSAAITSILVKKIKVNEAKPQIKGYRIQIFSISGVNSKDKANKEKAEFLLQNPDAHVYMVYNEPYFKIRIGDFRTKLEAYHYMYSIIKDYPFAFVVEDDVNIPYVEKDSNNAMELMR